jgi:hypothetical protein
VRNGDMEANEATRFMRGEGCPGCRFGTACPLCNGTGNVEPNYGEPTCCRGKGYVLAWRPHNTVGRYQAKQFYTGYEPNVRHLPGLDLNERTTMGVRTFPEYINMHRSADGMVEEWWVACPEGHAEKPVGDPCPCCKGTGKLTIPEPEEMALKAAESHLEASDEEPIGILINRGLL